MKRFSRLLTVGLAVLIIVSFTFSTVVGTDLRAIDADVQGGDRITRFLLLGCDRSSKLTDTILLVTLNETARQAHILQIPRDTYAEYTDRDYKKLNGAMNVLGERGVKQFLSEALGVPIHYFVILKLDFFEDLVDAIGGVDLVIPQDMDYEDPAQGLKIHLSAGTAHLNGDAAEQFVRFRSGYVNADLGRLDAQKLFLKAFAEQCKSLSVSQILRVTTLALTGVQTDIGLPEAIRIVGVLRECDTENLPMATLAGQAAKGKSGAWYYCLNREGACRMINEYLLPPVPMDLAEFDPNGIFDRAEYLEFHRIYQAPESALPVE
ncbi:MAG: LCP family protein [Clostridia bacterium]|nr:LCP family protein [Clostridia bacterium]